MSEASGADVSAWVDLRAPGGRLLARYDPARQLLEFRRGAEVVLVDLQRSGASPDVAVGSTKDVDTTFSA